MILAQRLKLLPGLRGNNIVMSVKVENAFSPSIVGNQADGPVARSRFRIASLQALAFEAALSQSVFEKLGAGAIIFSRRVLRGYGHQLGQQCGHFVLVDPEPPEKRADSRRTAALCFAHQPP